MSEWISVEDRLPAKPDDVIVFESIAYIVSDGSSVAICQFDRGHGAGHPWAEWSAYGDIRREDITHWQPLPPPPGVPE